MFSKLNRAGWADTSGTVFHSPLPSPPHSLPSVILLTSSQNKRESELSGRLQETEKKDEAKGSIVLFHLFSTVTYTVREAKGGGLGWASCFISMPLLKQEVGWKALFLHLPLLLKLTTDSCCGNNGGKRFSWCNECYTFFSFYFMIFLGVEDASKIVVFKKEI